MEMLVARAAASFSTSAIAIEYIGHFEQKWPSGHAAS